MVRVEVTELPPPDWDDLVLRAGREGSYFQSTTHAAAVAYIDQADMWYCRAVDETGAPLGGLLMEKHYFFDRRKGRRRFFLPFLSSLHGPFVVDTRRSEEAVLAILRAIRSRARRAGALWVAFRGLSQVGAYWNSEDMASLFARCGYERQSWSTLVVDLRVEEEALWSNLKRAARKAVVRCRNADVSVREVHTYEEFERCFWSPYVLSEAHFGRKTGGYPRGYWDIVRPHIRFFVACDSSNRTMGLLGMLTYNRVAREALSAITPEAVEAKIPAQDLLHWELICAAKSSDCDFFDLAGVNPRPATDKEAGIRRFKEKWGGEYREYFTYERNILPFCRQLAGAVGRWRS